MKAPSPTLMIYGAAAAVAAFVLWKFTKIGATVAEALPGVVSGDNALTRSQSNAAGERVTAYEGAGVVGTVGAAANTASGGVLASAGQAIGGWWASVTGADRDAEIAAMLKGSQATTQTASQTQWQRPPVTSSSDSSQADNLTRYSLLSGASFKDMASGDQINTFHNPDAYGGGLSLR